MSPGRPGALALAAVAVIAAVAVAIVMWCQRPVSEPALALPIAADVAHQQPLGPMPGSRSAKHGRNHAAQPDTAATSADPTNAGPIVVSVIGRVTHPGLVTLPAGSRVADAVHAAGDPVPGTDVHELNLARRLDDGEQIDVGEPSAGGSTADGTDSGSGTASTTTAHGSAARPGRGGKRSSHSSAAGGTVHLNHATVDDLLGLAGVGPVTAQRIVEWRSQHGRFTSVEQLQEVGGIGPSKFARLKDSVTL